MSHPVDHPAPEAPAPPFEIADLNTLQSLPYDDLLTMARGLGLRVRTESSRHYLTLDILRHQLACGGRAVATGFLEKSGDSGVLRWPRFGLKPLPEDVGVGAALLQPLGLDPGWMLRCSLRLTGNERSLTASEILDIEGVPAAQWKPLTPFDKLTPLFPNRRIFLEVPGKGDLPARAVDLVAPLGMGQRGIVAAPPRAGKTFLLKSLARAIRANHPQAALMLLLVDERPEEVTDFKAALDCEIYSSTFDEPVTRHVQVCEAVCERAKRLVECGRDVVILLDSITRMARGYNALQPGKGRTMSGGVDSKALTRPRKFFGSARNTEEGGSLTILATALIETHSRMDDLIFEEFKGTGNMEIYLDRQIADLRIFPAIHIVKSGT
ncbi:MAG: transcription termination factor Rho, partial [Terrimicrobiaceae bacterium]|nr:transcription termination factor Rho [Terrimicrobiaceae bacterium]